MRTHTITVVLAAALLTLTACSATSESDGKPSPTVTATVTATPTLSAAEQRQACVEAWADTIAARPDGFNPDTDSDTKPAECESIAEGDSLDVYMDGLMLSNQRAREALGG
jgi:ABC-type glycerol-3-phosphate transport system substrate-binding protein